MPRRGDGEGRIYQRPGSRFWHCAYFGPTKNGEWGEIRESTATDDEKRARTFLRDRLREVANHRDQIRPFQGPRAEKLTVGALLDSLFAYYERREIKSLQRTRIHAKPVREFFGHLPALAVTPDVVRRYAEARRAEKRPKSNATINRETEILSAAFSLAFKEERLARKPYIPTLPENNARTGFFERPEFEKILEKLSSPMDDMARFAYVSGWRKEEIRTLRWSNVDRGAREVILHDSKNGEGRVLPLDEETWKLFEKLWRAREYQSDGTTGISEYVFHADGRPVGEANFEKLWRRARVDAGLPEKLFHDFRRTASRNMIRAGVPQAVAMKITGHKTDSMFRRYNVTSSDDKREALRRVNAYVESLPAESNVTAFPATTDSSLTGGR